MTPDDLCKKLDGTRNLNRMKAVVDGKLKIIARMNPKGQYELTDDGKAVAAKFNAEDAVGVGISEKKPRKPRKPRQPKQTKPADSEKKAEPTGLNSELDLDDGELNLDE